MKVTIIMALQDNFLDNVQLDLCFIPNCVGQILLSDTSLQHWYARITLVSYFVYFILRDCIRLLRVPMRQWHLL